MAAFEKIKSGLKTIYLDPNMRLSKVGSIG